MTHKRDLAFLRFNRRQKAASGRDLTLNRTVTETALTGPERPTGDREDVAPPLPTARPAPAWSVRDSGYR